MNRPHCKRCKWPLDIWHDPESGIRLICNNPNTLQTDKEFEEYYNSLLGDEVAELEKWYGPIYEPNCKDIQHVEWWQWLWFILGAVMLTLTFSLLARKVISVIVKNLFVVV